MQDLDNDVLYPFFLDVGRPVVSYVEDFAALPMYPLAYRRHQGSLKGSHRFFVRCITSIASSTRDSHGTLRVRISSLSSSVASLYSKSSRWDLDTVQTVEHTLLLFLTKSVARRT